MCVYVEKCLQSLNRTEFVLSFAGNIHIITADLRHVSTRQIAWVGAYCRLQHTVVNNNNFTNSLQ